MGPSRLKWLARARSWRFAGLTLLTLCLAVYAPGLTTLPPVDRDESRFAQASRQMFESVALPANRIDEALHSGGLAVPMLQDRPRLNKPPLIYWLQALSAAAFTGGDPLRDAIWMYRVPSLLAAVAAVLLTWRLGLKMFDPRAAWLAGALLAVSPIVVWESRQARADMVLLAATTAAIAGLYGAWRAKPGRVEGAGWLAPLMLWLGVGAGVMTKGPITPLVVALTAIAVSLVGRRWAWMGRTRPLLGLVIVAACVAPWIYAIASRVGLDRYWAIVQDEVFKRSVESKEGHWGPPGYHLVLLCVLFWPGTLVTALAVRRAIRRCRRPRPAADSPRLRPELFLLAWIVPSWIVFELVSTKLPHYTLPLYPAVALISARAVFAAASGRLAGVNELLTRIGFGIWLLIGAVLALVACAAAFVPHRDSPAAVSGVALVALVIGIALNAARHAVRRGRFVIAQNLGVGVAALIGIALVGAAFPHIREFWISPRVVASIPPQLADRPLAAIGFHEDSLVFATRARVARIDEADAPDWLRDHPGGVIVASPGVLGRLGLAPLADPDGAPVAIKGLNYSQGDAVELWLGTRPGDGP